MKIQLTPEQIRDFFQKECLECFNLAEKEIKDLFDEIGQNNKCNQGFLYEELRNTPNRNKYFTNFFLKGPKELVTKKGFGSSFFYQCTLYSHELGIRLNRFTDELQSTLECDEI